MTARHMMLAVVLGASLTACGEEAKPVAKKVAPAAFPAGEWEVTALTEKLASSDKSTPATRHKVGSTETNRICSPAGPKPAPALFADKGDTCTLDSDYAKNGRINMSMQCKRAGGDQLALTLDGKYDATTFEVVVITGTYFAGAGDYALTQKMTGKRIGDCPPEGTAPAAAG
jgi:Protein of unknown function (DUF3617)